jgi:hypothetical protein
LTNDEYESLIRDFRRFADARQTDEQKEALSQLFYSLIAKAYGSDPTIIAEMEEETLGELWVKLFHVELGEPLLRDVLIKNLKAVDVNLIQDLHESAKAFIELPIDDYEWRRLVDSQVLYWVPAQIFPGYK